MISGIKLSNKRLSKGHLDDFKSSKNMLWIDSLNPDKKELEEISRKTGIPKREIEMAINSGERPRIVDLYGHTLVIFRAPYKREHEIKTVSLAIFIAESSVMTVRKTRIEAIDRINALPDEIKKDMLQNMSQFFYRLLDEIINTYFTILDEYEDEIDIIEDKVFHTPEKKFVRKIFDIKKTLIYFHKSLAANREVITAIEKEYSHAIKKSYIRLFRNLYNDITQLIDVVATYRDILTGTLDIYISAMTHNLNIIIKRLTVYASYILVPTLISGIYGMNFRWMPEIYWKYGYFFALGLMVLSIAMIYVSFKKVDWI